MWRKIVGNFIIFLLCCFGIRIYAEDSAQTKALDAIAAFAERICTSVPTSGSSVAGELSGKAKAELTGLVKKVADLGIEGAAKYQSTEYQGVLQQDLASLLSKDADCRVKISDKLIDKLIPNAEGEGKKNQISQSGSYDCQVRYRNVKAEGIQASELEGGTIFFVDRVNWPGKTGELSSLDLSGAGVVAKGTFHNGQAIVTFPEGHYNVTIVGQPKGKKGELYWLWHDGYQRKAGQKAKTRYATLYHV